MPRSSDPHLNQDNHLDERTNTGEPERRQPMTNDPNSPVSHAALPDVTPDGPRKPKSRRQDPGSQARKARSAPPNPNSEAVAEGAKVTPPPATPLEKAKKMFRKWLELPDDLVLDFMFGVVEV